MSAAEITWTPATDPTTLPAAGRHDFGPHRVYFYDLDTRTEIKDHPLAGMYWSSTGPMVAHQGRYVDTTTTGIGGTAYLNGKARLVQVTAASFPGRRVAAKVWHVGEAEWRVLAEGDGTRPTGQLPRAGIEAIGFPTRRRAA